MSQNQAKPFEQSTRLKYNKLPTMVRPTGGGTVSQVLPAAGILQGIYIPIVFSVAGTLTVPNAYGYSSVVKRIQLSLNTGQNLIDISGAGYHWLVRDMLNEHYDLLSYTVGRTAVATGTATNARLDFYLPIALNNRDQLGLLNLQSKSLQVTLSITFEADATVATGATVTATAYPMLKVFDVPLDKRSWPNFNNLVQLLEQQNTVAASGDFDYSVPLGGVITGLYSLAKGGWTASKLIAQQTNTIENHDIYTHMMRYADTTGRDTTLAGAITGIDKRVMYDYAGTDGFGEVGTTRDVLDTNGLTSLIHRITLAGADTLISVRRQIVVF